jgi:hypothetical protein
MYLDNVYNTVWKLVFKEQEFLSYDVLDIAFFKQWHYRFLLIYMENISN